MTPQVVAGDPTLNLAFAHGGPVLQGKLRTVPEDFVVEEELGYTVSGNGEHAFLRVCKRERNTLDVARTLARFATVPEVAVGFAGLKDRNAVTTQYFSVQLPGRESPDWNQIGDAALQIVDLGRHDRKIRRGTLRGNRFSIRVRGIVGDRTLAEQRLAQIAAQGVPNYFGSQRFGTTGQNLRAVDDLFARRGRRPGRERRGILLSAARSQLFNQVLDVRVRADSWHRALPGEVMLLAGSQRQFAFDAADETLLPRLRVLDVHPSGPLYGRPSRSLSATDEAAEIERAVLEGWSDWCEGLQRFGVDADWRALRLAVGQLAWEWQQDDLLLSFALTAGGYATAVLRELVHPDVVAD